MSRIAVVGAGIAGLSAAWLLRERHDVTLFEALPRAGGHADTQVIVLDGVQVAVDTGFIVLNDRNYPNLTGLFEALGVPTQDSEMSFSASLDGGRFEYGGGTLRQLFTQKSNLVRPRFWRMLRDLMRFYREAPALLDDQAADGLSLGEFLDRGGYGEGFVQDHILPMGAAIWSAPLSGMRAFPARHFARFFHNHGLLSLNDRPQWRTVTGGSRVYVAKVLEALGGRVRLGCGVTGVRRKLGGGVTVQAGDDGGVAFDQVVFACHADQALALLEDATAAERRVLGAVRCTDNVAVLHGDARLMPRRRGVWSAWNYLSPAGGDAAQPVSLTYWMNCLQGLTTRLPVLVTLNPQTMPAAALTYATRHYRHPQFDVAAMRAQAELPGIQGLGGTWFAGAWTGWGFHEDGIASAVRVARALGAAIPWAPTAVAPERLAA